jgi:PAS domain S-box-containing protein
MEGYLMVLSKSVSRRVNSRPTNLLSKDEPVLEDSILSDFKNEKFIINKESAAFLRKFLESVPAAIAIFDTEMKYIFISNRWRVETNVNHKDLIGKCHYDIVPDIPLKWKKLHARCLSGEHLKSPQDLFKREDGTIEWINWEIIPWYRPEGSIGGLIMFVEHITKHKTLEEKMMEMIKTLNQSNAELERFAHICAHDLNEPLRTIANYASLLEKEEKENLSHNIKRYLYNINNGVKHMTTLVNGILNYSQFGSSSIIKNFFPLEQVIYSVKQALEKTIKDKNAFIHTEGNLKIYGDAGLIARVFQNLISNSLKFNESDMPIVYISVKEKDSSFLFIIEDNGIGIQKNYHKKIFELFSRLHPRSKYKGAGIGLSISKKIIEAHGGKIWVKSTPNVGSQFFFTLPKPEKLV